MSNGINPDIKELLALRHYATNIKFFNKMKVNTAQTGSHLSVARGRGMDFDEVRRYQNGDDIRLIHWPLTARLGKPYTKIYKEERERAVYLLVDQSYSMQFGTRVCFKNVLAAKIAAIFGWAALNHHEQIGGIVFNDDRAQFIKPRRSRQSMLDLFNLITNPLALAQPGGGLNNALQLIYKKLQSGSIVIVISDYFLINEETETYLRLIGQKSELINVLVYDPLEAALPSSSGHYTFTGDGKSKLDISANTKTCKLYSTPFENRLAKIKQINQQFLQVATNDDLVQKINYGVFKRHGY
ncbi:MAG: hypothetical protein K0R14_427 [Burkholderiales bacterium]|jgi:uncharacterized protein (DUF58 family)|nr:hypothetical protein [Burkholderiales bacterium]